MLTGFFKDSDSYLLDQDWSRTQKNLSPNTSVPNRLTKVPCKRRSSVNSGAWLRRFDDVTGVEESCVAKGINRKKKKKIFHYCK